MSKIGKALASLLMEEFVDDSLEVNNLVLQTCSKVALTNLSVLACFDGGNRKQEKDEKELKSPEPPKKKRKRGRKPGRRKKKQSPFEGSGECVFSDVDFKFHFNMSKTTFEKLCAMLAPGLIARSVSVEKKVLVSLWTLNTREPTSAISERFLMSKGFLHNVFYTVCGVIASMQQNYIIMPETDNYDVISSGFQERCPFPGVIGVIGCTHIPIREPTKSTELYINKEGSFSMQLQAVCDDKFRFLDVYTGCPGKMQGLAIFKESPLHQILEEYGLPPDKYIVGDCSLPLREYLMVPFRENRPLTVIEETFNFNLTKTHSNIEFAFRLLKKKFARLQFLDMKKLDDIPTVLICACVLHNFLLLEEEIDDEMNEENLVGVGNEYDVDIIPEPCPVGEIFPDGALIKRMDIANTFQSIMT